MKKILFAAVSLPIVMASCTQDALENEMAPVNTPNAKGFQLELAPTLSDGNMTRGYDADKLNMWFEGDDQINMFWLGTIKPTGVYEQGFNSIFSIETNGTDGSNAFKSKSLVYAGYNVATFPGQYTTSAGDIVLTVENEPDGIENIPFISNLIDLSCTNTTNNIQENNQNTGNLQPGFNNKLSFPMKQAANYAELDINVSNIATDIEGYATDGIKINKITFISDVNAFATSAKVQTVDETVKNNGIWGYNHGNGYKEVKPIVAEAKAVATGAANELASTAVTTVSNENINATTTGKAYLMSFPTNATTNTGSIVIETNMGKVTIESTVDPLDPTKNTTPLFKGTDNVTVESLFTALAKENTASNKSKNFEGEVVGYAPLRTLNIDMKNAKINGSVVENSADILRYIALHKAIGSTEEVTLVLSKKVVDEGVDFAGLTEEAVKALDGAGKFELDINGNNTIKLLGGGNVQKFMLGTDKFVSAPITYELAAAQWTAAEGLDTKVLANIINNGVLTISEVADKDFAVELTNNGTVKLADGATVVFDAVYTANEGSTTSVRSSAIMKFTANAAINGNVNVNNDFIAAESATVTFGTTAKVTNNDFISTNGESAKIINLGTITVAKDDTHTLITANEDATNKGTIVLNSRDNEVSVGKQDDMGYISIKSSQIGNAYEFAEGDKMNKIILDQDGKFTFKTNNKIAFVDVEANASIINGTGGESVVFAGLKVAEAKELTVSTGNVVRVKAKNEEIQAWIGGKTRCEGTTIGKNAKIIVAGSFEYGTCANVNGFYQAGSGVVKP